jgi:hypothetical protein
MDSLMKNNLHTKKGVNRKIFINFLRSLYLMPDIMEIKIKFHKIHYRFYVLISNLIKIQLI